MPPACRSKPAINFFMQARKSQSFKLSSEHHCISIRDQIADTKVASYNSPMADRGNARPCAYRAGKEHAKEKGKGREDTFVRFWQRNSVACSVLHGKVQRCSPSFACTGLSCENRDAVEGWGPSSSSIQSLAASPVHQNRTLISVPFAVNPPCYRKEWLLKAFVTVISHQRDL